MPRPDGGGGGGGAELGGAIFLRSGASATLLNCRFTNNGAQHGMGGGAGNYKGVAGNAGSNGQGKGGAIFAMPGASVVATGVAFIGNTADDAGALNTDNADIYGNISFAQGTAIGFERSTLQVHAGTFLLHIPVHIVTSDGQSTTDAASVDYSTIDGTAHSDIDYVSAHGTLTFRPGTASGTTIDIDIELLDSGIQPTRAFGVSLSNFGRSVWRWDGV